MNSHITSKTTFTNTNIQILGLSETWLSDVIPTQLVDLPGYTMYRNDRKFVNPVTNQTKKGGGVCLFISNNLNCMVHHLAELDKSTADIESQWVELSFANQKNVIVCNLYRPPQGDTNQYLKYIESCLECFDYVRKDLFIMGDANIDVLDKTSPKAKELKEFLLQCGLTNHIKEVSRYANEKNSCLDHIYSNCNIVNDCGTLDISISDHLPIFLDRKKMQVLQNKVEFTGRSYLNYNTEIFTDELNARPWDKFDAETDPNVLWKIFHDNVYQTLDVLCPSKKFSIKKYKEPWVTNEHLELIRDKDQALEKAKKSKSEDNWVTARRLRNECLSKLRKARCEFVKNELYINANDSKKFWRNINEIWPNKESKSTKITLIDNDSKLEIKQEDTADYINNFFYEHWSQTSPRSNCSLDI